MIVEPGPSPWLSASEVRELTGRQKWKAQAFALARMGIPFRPNGYGRPLVERTAVLGKRGKAA
jgi:hypothetical protein